MKLEWSQRQIDSDGLGLEVSACTPTSPRALVVMLHGIPSDAPRDPDDPGFAGLAERFAGQGWAAAWGHMRGVNGSPGYFSLESWVCDATAMIDGARSMDNVVGLPVAVVGFSAGGAVATEVVRRGVSVSALVLIGAPAEWASFADGAADGVRKIVDETGLAVAPEVVKDPTSWAREFYETAAEEGIGEIRIPVLIVHGAADEVVPVDHAYRIVRRAAAVDLEVVEGGSHQLRRHPEAIEIVLTWLGRVL